MPSIRPSSDLRNSYNDISEYCHRYHEPVYITKNGTGDLAVMSIETYESLVGKLELRTMLEKGLEDVSKGKTKPANKVFSEIEGRFTNEEI